MQIGDVKVRVTAVTLAVFLFFIVLIAVYVFATGDIYSLFWTVPAAAMLLLIPMALNYMSQKQYASLVPMYEAEAKNVRIREINLNKLGEPIRIKGVVERVYFQFLNRPQYLVADRTGEISVKMFTSPAEDVQNGDVVEVLGTVVKRYIMTGEAVVNCVSIRKIKNDQ
ncbi:nucleotide-binding protein [Methanoculleus sp. MH98A]|uniref:nucleotide-binding protein n=1 Tax=Methanoculleus sp. MH98A TaxID=1495314 RepID=UPI0004A0C5AB|nr:nucleotide-binding protein [Methanoculleus sp. MH98A]KDE54325.1 nucleotide-binding protein [Methanoculleus sp. MH98A]KDE55925.1 nucleotide-binding protein [Methanoculleus sp. MH98A]